jgi:TrpR-related protein YerC/YecD
MPDLRTQEVENLLTVLSGTTNNNDAFSLLEDLFTIREIKDISQRLEVARLLKEGESYASIEKTTGASATTIARVSKALNYGSGGYQMALEILENKGQ